MISEQQITDALKAVKYPGYSRDIVSFGIVKHVAASNGAATMFEMTVPEQARVPARIIIATSTRSCTGSAGPSP